MGRLGVSGFVPLLRTCRNELRALRCSTLERKLHTGAVFSAVLDAGPLHCDRRKVWPPVEWTDCIATGEMLQDFEASFGLFSEGLTVPRTTMILFSVSNQNGAPRDKAPAVMHHPTTAMSS